MNSDGYLFGIVSGVIIWKREEEKNTTVNPKFVISPVAKVKTRCRVFFFKVEKKQVNHLF